MSHGHLVTYVVVIRDSGRWSWVVMVVVVVVSVLVVVALALVVVTRARDRGCGPETGSYCFYCFIVFVNRPTLLLFAKPDSQGRRSTLPYSQRRAQAQRHDAT